MKKLQQIILSTVILCFGTLQSFAQNTEGGGGFTIDGIEYEVLSFNPNEVSVFNATVTDEVEIPATVTFQDVTYNVIAIGSNSFQGNTGLTSVTIPGTVESISSFAFSNTGLTEVTALGTVPPSLQANTFDDTSVIALTVPVGAEDAYLGNGWTGFASINGTNPNFVVNNIAYSLNSLSANTVSVTGSSITGSGVTIPSNVTFTSTNYTVTEIAAGALQDNQLTSVSLPSTLTKIGSFAFRNNQLTSVIIPNAVTEIALSTFRDNQLATITLPNTMTRLGERAFQNNQLTSVTIPTGITIIEDNVFRNNNLSSITIPDGVTEIGVFSFDDNNLTTITIPASVTNIGSFAFSNSPLDEIISLATTPPTISNPDFIFGDFETTGSIDLTVPTGTETAYANAGWVGFNSVNGVVALQIGSTFDVQGFLYTITALAPNEVNAAGGSTIPTNLVIPETVTTQNTMFTVVGIENAAFENEGITSVSFPNTLRDLGEVTFRFNAISEVVIPDGITEIPQRCFSNNDITSVSLPESLEIIGFRSFENNDLTSIDLPDALITIASFSFRNSELRRLVIPPNVTSIGEDSFLSNPLVEIIAEGFTPSAIQGDSFTGRSNIDVFVPTGNVQTYIDNGWTGFKSVNGASKTIVLKVYLQGASLNPNTGEENLMRDDLRVAGIIPTTSPYGDGAIADASVFMTTGEDAIVDWIFVELRGATNNTNIIESASALLQRDGDIVTTDGVSPFVFTAAANDYFIAIKHRNHLGIMLANAKRLSSVITSIDFADANNPETFGTNAQTDAGMPVNTLGMWAGNVNGDTFVQYLGGTPDTTAILSAALNDPGNFLNFSTFIISGYSDNDVNMSGTTQYEGGVADSPLILQNVLAHPGNFLNFSTFQIQEQLPQN